jgi:hypothetical protein
MPCRPLKSANLSGLLCPKDVLKALDAELAELANIAAETDFTDEAQGIQFKKNVEFIKCYFERYERLIRDGITA